MHQALDNHKHEVMIYILCKNKYIYLQLCEAQLTYDAAWYQDLILNKLMHNNTIALSN